MEDIELVIRIPKEIYSRILERNRIHTFDNETVCDAIKNGTPLPKGHGRLVDEKDLSLMTVHMIDGMFVCTAPTILEADKKYEAKVITRGNCMICGKELTEGLFFCKECETKAIQGRK